MNEKMLKRQHNSKASEEQARLYTEYETVRYWLDGLEESTAAQYLRYARAQEFLPIVILNYPSLFIVTHQKDA